jgi:hypothetical protein
VSLGSYICRATSAQLASFDLASWQEGTQFIEFDATITAAAAVFEVHVPAATVFFAAAFQRKSRRFRRQIHLSGQFSNGIATKQIGHDFHRSPLCA